MKNDDLVILPRREYEKLLSVSRKSMSQLDSDLEEAIKEVRNGKAIGPFSSIKELKKALEK